MQMNSVPVLFLPYQLIQRYYESEEGQKELRQWEARRQAKEVRHG